jgi:hypothetical protein
LIIKKLHFIKMGIQQYNSVEIPICTPNGFIIEPAIKLLTLLQTMKLAS